MFPSASQDLPGSSLNTKVSVTAEVTGCLTSTFPRDLPEGGQQVPVVRKFHSEEEEHLRLKV